MDDTAIVAVGNVDAGAAGAAARHGEGRAIGPPPSQRVVELPPPACQPVDGLGDLPPLCNTGGNSPNERETFAKMEHPGQLGIGWLKIRHTKNSYALWSDYRVRLGLGEGAELCSASKQRRAYGVRLHWGAYEYWGWPPGRNELWERDELPAQGEYLLTILPQDIAKMQTQGVRVRLPEGETVLTEWSDDALNSLGMLLKVVDGVTILSLLGDLLGAGAKVTRLDISADFASSCIDPVVLSMEARDFLPMRRCRLIDSRGDGPTGGRTCYFGKRGSEGGGLLARFYEKGREQGLPIDLLRYEVELCGDKAHDAAMKLAMAPENWWAVGAGILAGAIDFRDGYGQARGGAHALRDCPQAGWWVGLRSRLAAAVKLEIVKRPDATLISMRDWAEESWGRVAAMLQAWMGPSRFAGWFAGILEKGAERMTEKDLAILRAAQRCAVPF